jgi:uncharacterized protein (TIGR00297 family)
MQHCAMTTPQLRRGARHLIAAFIAAALVATIARRVRALSPGGALAATAVGSAILTGAGLRGAAATLTFFISSSLLGRLPGHPGRRQRRGNERDAVQVIANGGVAAALALAARNSRERQLLLSGLSGALATAAADTWATEIGSRATTRPRSVTTGKLVPVGASGGVSWQGLLASATGALSVSAVMSLGASPDRQHDLQFLRAVVIGGFCGALADSVLGATVQEERRCPVCGEETELPRHDCGTPTTVVRGIPRFSNDVVNFASTVVGAAVAIKLSRRTALHPKTRRPRYA